MSERPKTLAEWRELPWLLTRKQVLAITGWEDAELRQYLAKELITRTSATRKGRYPLVQIAALCKVPL